MQRIKLGSVGLTTWRLTPNALIWSLAGTCQGHIHTRRQNIHTHKITKFVFLINFLISVYLCQFSISIFMFAIVISFGRETSYLMSFPKHHYKEDGKPIWWQKHCLLLWCFTAFYLYCQWQTAFIRQSWVSATNTICGTPSLKYFLSGSFKTVCQALELKC